jgi:Tfp pilus assembly protein PilV
MKSDTKQVSRYNDSTALEAGRPRNQRCSGKSGFTLLETAIAAVLMAIVGLGIASLFSYAAHNTQSAGDRQLAMAVAQQRMEELRNVAFTDSTLTATSVSGTSATTTSASRHYVVVTTITDSNIVNGQATVKTITVQVTPQTGDPLASGLFGSVTMVSARSALKIGPYRAL